MTKIETGIDSVTAEIVGSVEVDGAVMSILIRKNSEDNKSSCYLVDGKKEIDVAYKVSDSDEVLKELAIAKAAQLNDKTDLSSYF